MRSRRIEIAIEELVLHGLDPRDRDGVREAIERELQRLFSERGLPQSPAERGSAQLEHAGVEVEAGSKAQAIGARVAHTVYCNLAGSAAKA